MAHVNDPAVIRRLLDEPGRWAIVGLSTNTDRTAYGVARFVQRELGKEIVPVHPKAEAVHGAEGYATLADVPGDIDVVDVFVRSALAGAVVDQAIDAAAGLDVVMDTCPVIEARR